MTLDTSNRYALTCAFLSKYYGGFYEGAGADLNDPVPTIRTKDSNALITSHLIQMNHNSIGQPVTEPLNTITAGANHFGEVRAFLLKYYGADVGQDIKTPLHTVTSKDRFGLVTIKGEDYQIVDIGMRMLTPRELFNAQGFPPDYIIDYDFEGKEYPKTAQVARCGNAVPPPFATALVKANLPEICKQSEKVSEVG
jgi:DNA (cytosine-5)-methyltransferase 1